MEKLDKALDTEKKLEGKAADLLIAASEGAVTPSVAKGGMDVQGKAANDAGMNGQGGDQHGTATDNTMTGQMAQDLVSMPLETQMQIMGQMSPSQQGEMMEKFEHQLTELLENFDGSRESMQEINDLLMSMRALGNQMPKSEGMPDVGPMAAAVTGESGEDIQKMLIDGILEQTKKDRDDFNEKLGELDGSSGGASGAGGGGASGSIKRIAAVLGQLSEEIFDKLEAKGKALGDEPTTGEVAEFQGDSAVAQAFYKAATEIINQLGKAMSDGVKTRG